MRRYMRDVYRKTHPQVTITLSETQHRQLKTSAQRSGRTLTAYLRESAFAYMAERYLVPRDIEDSLSGAIMEFRAIGNNINQIAKHSNTQRRASLDDIKQSLELVRQLEKQVIRFCSHPSQHGHQVDE